MEGERRNINPALWLECAGPLITLPSIGSHVVYFPQGHSEQVIASTQKEAEAQIPSYPNLPAQLICQLHNVTLHADQENDEVYAQMTLQPVNGQQQVKDLFLSPDHGIQPKQPTISFSKTLTASDTSTHGGFSIPRRAAEKVFPPLDYNKQPPAQELVARDLHNNEWHFRHIYRGQPRRHLLTTGWSVFVSAKRLQAGDTVLFMRDESGQLLLGIRRANRQQTNMPSSLLSSDSMLIGVLAAAAHAASTSSRFTIFYNPRASPSEFVIPLARYNKAIYHTQVSVGMRFRMEMETEDSSTRRYMGTITGIGDLDSSRWPGSYWRSLKVGWDESTAGQRQRRVSLWEIEPLTAPFLLCNPSLLLRPKRLRPGEDDLEASMKRSIWGRAEDSMNFSGMGMEHWLRLQQRPDAVTPAVQPDYYHAMAVDALQEIRTAHSKQLIQQHNPPVIQFQQMQFGAQNQQAQLPPIIQTSKQQMQQQHSQGQQMQLPNLPTDSMMQNPTAVQQTSLNLPSSMRSSANYGESEISHAAVPPFSLQSILTKGNQGNLVGDEDTEFPPLMRPNQSYMQKQQPGMLPGSGLITQENQAARNWLAAMKDTGHPDAQQMSFSMPRPDSSGQVPLGPAVHSQSNPHDQESVQSDPRSSHLLFGVSIDGPLAMSDAASSFQQVGFTKGKDMQSQFMTCSTSGSEMQMNANMVMNGNLDENGFLQQASNWPQQVYPPPVRTFTKVHKLGSVGRSLDVTRFKTYEDLRAELARMFNLEGQLDEPRSGWQVVFVDNENDMLLLGDDPWEEFVSCVRCIKILSPSEVLQMNQEQMGWLSSVQVQPRQTSSSSDDCIMRQDHRNILGQESHMPSGNMTTGPRNPGMGSNYSDPSCISDGI